MKPLHQSSKSPLALLQLGIVEIGDRIADTAYRGHELDSTHRAQLGRLSRRQPAELEELGREKKLRFPDEVFLGIPGGKEDVRGKLDREGVRTHGISAAIRGLVGYHGHEPMATSAANDATSAVRRSYPQASTSPFASPRRRRAAPTSPDAKC